MSLPQLLMNRELRMPLAEFKVEGALDQITANHLAKDCFRRETLELAQSFYHRIFRCQDLVAVLSMEKTGQRVQRLALWSLITKCKLWDIEITQNYQDSHPGRCKLSKCGMVLIEVPSTNDRIIVFDGQQSGVLPPLTWYSLNPIGKRILGCWFEIHDPNNPMWDSDNSDLFFGEWDQKGRLLYRYQLDYTKERRWYHTNVYDENFWVRLVVSQRTDLESIIEVFDRVLGEMKTFQLPLNQGIVPVASVSRVCIFQNQFFFPKESESGNGKLTICIFDLIKGAIIDEFPIGEEAIKLGELVVTQHYAAWLEYREGGDNCVAYLDISNRTIKHATDVPFCLDNSRFVLNIVGTILSVIYAENNWDRGSPRWHRKVIDMTNGELKCDVRYQRYIGGDCSLENGTLLLTDILSNQPRMYTESFIGDGPTSETSTFRCEI